MNTTSNILFRANNWELTIIVWKTSPILTSTGTCSVVSKEGRTVDHYLGVLGV